MGNEEEAGKTSVSNDGGGLTTEDAPDLADGYVGVTGDGSLSSRCGWKWCTTANSVTVVGVTGPLSLLLYSLSTDMTLVGLRDRASSSLDK